MSLHKLSAGSGYDYLTRQVAALDATDRGRVGLADYYAERGESPGVWVGAGMDGIDGLAAGDVVTAEQMRNLFGHGLHPLAGERAEHLQGLGLAAVVVEDARRLGRLFPVIDGAAAFRVEVARRVAALSVTTGQPVDAAGRAWVRTEVARQFFREEHPGEIPDARQLAELIAKGSQPMASAVAGYDLTFSPVKSVSTLWAVADMPVARAIEQAHQAAVRDALSFIESHALFSRTGPQGLRQVGVRGLVAAAFTHRDSRAGDPDLHTHVAVANKVQTLDGRWLAIDGRVLFKANVAASETYNTALERHLRATLGVRFTERPRTDPSKRPIREIVGVDPRLTRHWSSRRKLIDVRRGELAVQFQADHGRPPTAVEALHLAQQATLETREAKHEPRSLAEQRRTWMAEAVSVLGSRESVATMVRTALAPSPSQGRTIDAAWAAATADRIVAITEQSRSTWQAWHVRAEAERQVRGVDVSPGQSAALVELLVSEVLDHRSIALVAPPDGIEEPAALPRTDGSSVYTVVGATRYTSRRILDAEQRLVAAAGRADGTVVDASTVDLALLELAANGTTLDAGQAALVRQMCISGARLQLAIAPAGAGKTTAVRGLTTAWTQDGGQVVGLAPSAAAAAVLTEQTGIPADTLAKLTWSIHHHDLPDWAHRIDRSTLVIIDEAGMADTLSLDTAVRFILGRGASVRLVGDDQQLGAIGAGGVLRDIRQTYGALQLTELHRFSHPAEAAASLALRNGDPRSVYFYLLHGRVHVGDLARATDDAFTAWARDRQAGLDALMLAPTRELVAELNRRGRESRLDGVRSAREVLLADGNHASPGDVIITRTNDRRLRVSGTDWVKNGDRWTVTAVGRLGDLRVRHTRSGLTTRLPAAYVQTSTGLGYATTIHGAQGVSADTTHGLLTGQESRQQLYTMLTRGRHANHIYLQVVGDGDPHSLIRPETVAPSTPTEILREVVARDDTPTSATTTLAELSQPITRLRDALQRYEDARRIAIEHVVGPAVMADLDRIDQYLPGLTSEPLWPTIRAGLLERAADTGHHPYHHLRTRTDAAESSTVRQLASTVHWRMITEDRSGGITQSLLAPIPHGVQAHPVWGPYLAQRAQLVNQLDQQVRLQVASQRAERATSNAAHGRRQDRGHTLVHRPVGPAGPRR